MTLRRTARVLLAAAALPLVAASAQDSTRTGEPGRPTADLLRVARESADNLRYAEAGKTALSVLSMTGATLAERVDALQLAALASYSEEDSSARNEGLALNLLKQRFRLVPYQGLERRYTWSGLDRLYERLGRTEVVVEAAADSVQESLSTDGRIGVTMRSTRPVRWQLVVSTAGRTQLLDSIPDAQANGQMRFATFDGQGPTLAAGSHQLLVIGGDSLAADTVRLDVVLDAPAFAPVLPPEPLTDSAFEPETRRSLGLGGGLVRGLFLAGVTAAAASQLRLDEPLRTGLNANGAAFGAAAGLAIGAVVLAKVDPGMPDVAARGRNTEKRAAHAAAIASATAETAQRRSAYKVTARVTPVPRSVR